MIDPLGSGTRPIVAKLQRDDVQVQRQMIDYEFSKATAWKQFQLADDHTDYNHFSPAVLCLPVWLLSPLSWSSRVGLPHSCPIAKAMSRRERRHRGCSYLPVLRRPPDRTLSLVPASCSSHPQPQGPHHRRPPVERNGSQAPGAGALVDLPGRDLPAAHLRQRVSAKPGGYALSGW